MSGVFCYVSVLNIQAADLLGISYQLVGPIPRMISDLEFRVLILK